MGDWAGYARLGWQCKEAIIGLRVQIYALSAWHVSLQYCSLLCAGLLALQIGMFALLTNVFAPW